MTLSTSESAAIYSWPMARKKTTKKKMTITVSTTFTERNCDYCGEKYWAQRSTSRYCSGTCRVSARRARLKEK